MKNLEKDQKRSKMAQTLTLEQKKAIFDMVDKDQDGEINYREFQAVLPQKPKDASENIQEVFKRADTDSDGFLDLVNQDCYFILHVAQIYSIMLFFLG
jgi:Ca2+-binding EF-hand superfamily protein